MFHYNPSISEDTNRILNLKSGDNNNEVGDHIQPTIEIQPKAIVRSAGQTASGIMTVFTTPIDKDFYITGYALGYVKDVLCDTATGDIALTIVIDGVTRSLFPFPILTLTAQSDTATGCVVPPIKVDRGTQINLGGTFGAGNMRRTASIYGFFRETLKGV